MTATIEVLPSRASVLDAETLARLNTTMLPKEFGLCDGCASIFVTMGDRARHLNIDGDCPRDLLSEYGKRPGDSLLVVDRTGHHMLQHVHGLNADGTPRIWGNGATHQDTCPCIVDPEQWAIDHPERRLVSVKDEA